MTKRGGYILEEEYESDEMYEDDFPKKKSSKNKRNLSDSKCRKAQRALKRSFE